MSQQADDRKWKVLAEQYRQAAEALPHGPKRDEIMRKARQLETAAHGTDWANSSGLQPPRKGQLSQ